MASNPGDREAAKAKADRTAEELGRRAARLLRRGRPRVEQALKDARPRVERAVEQAKPQAEKAWRYAQAHEDEIKRAALKGARMRIRGPFGFLFDALQTNNRPAPGPAACLACGAAYHPNARFCSECGAPVPGSES
jgi:hypothetical protein